MHAPSYRVLIVGAGPVGLTLALGLARQGVRSLVIDRARQAHTEPRATTLWPRTLEILQQLQALDAVRPHAQVHKSLAPFWPGDAAPLFDVSMRHLCGPTSLPVAWTLPQSQTEAGLARTLTEAGASAIRRGHRLLGFERLTQGVRAVIKPDDAAAYALDTDFLVGCDGASSDVRNQLHLALGGAASQQQAFCADVMATPAFGAALARVHQRVLCDAAGATFGHRVSGDLWRVTGMLAAGEVLTEGHLARRCRSLLPKHQQRIARAHAFVLQDRPSSRYVDGRIVLAGDAAHLRSWTGSQGLNLGMHDAHNLAWKLARACDDGKPGDIALLLHAYQSERRLVTSGDMWAQLLTYANGPWTRPLGWSRVSRIAVGSSLALALTKGPLRAWLGAMAGFGGVRYRHSSLLLGHHVLVGAPAPNVRMVNDHGAAQHMLDGLLGHGLLLLFDAGSGAQVLPALRHGLAGIEGVALRRVVPSSHKVGPMCLGDVHNEAYAHWQAKDGMVALVRPDGYIGWVSAMPPTTEEVWTHVRHALGMVPKAMPSHLHKSTRPLSVSRQASA